MAGRLAPASSSRLRRACPAGRRRDPGADEFELPLTPPLLGDRPVGAAAPRDPVVAELGKHRVVGAVQQANRPGGGDPRHRAHRTVPDDGQHHVEQLGRYVGVLTVAVVAPKRRAHFGAGVGTRGQLQMPACVEPAGAAAQRDSLRRQIPRRGVEVHGVQRLRRGLARPGHLRETGKRRRRCRLADVELALDFQIARCARTRLTGIVALETVLLGGEGPCGHFMRVLRCRAAQFASDVARTA